MSGFSFVESLYSLPSVAKAAGQAREVRAAFGRLLAAGVVEGIDVQVVTRLGQLINTWDVDVLVACAAALRAPRHGHICVDLAADAPWPAAADEYEGAPVDWPERVSLTEKLNQNPLVGAPEQLVQTMGRAPFVFDGQRLYTARLYDDQQRLLERLTTLGSAADTVITDAALLSRGLARLFKAPEPTTGTGDGVDRQQLAALMACLRRFTVVAGGPGMGKTYTVRSILTLLFAQRAQARRDDPEVGALRVALAAPTGKAAARMREALVKNMDAFIETAREVMPEREDADALGVSLLALEARTLHRLLGTIRDDPTRFRYHVERPLPYDVVVVDETSMVDLAMMARLLDAVGDETRVIFLGDRHQLASVEAGSVLADICGDVGDGRLSTSRAIQVNCAKYGINLPGNAVRPESGARLLGAVTQLNLTYRFTDKSSIGCFAKACVAADFDAKHVASWLFREAEDVTILEPGDGRRLPSPVLTAILKGYGPAFRAQKAARGVSVKAEAEAHLAVIKAFDTFRVLCPHRQGALGVAGVNEVVERALPRRGIKTSETFWLGRPVLVLQNDYDVGLFNGDIGVVVERTAENGVRQRAIVFPCADASLEGGAHIRYVAPSRLPRHQTAFAFTIHKSQGSEFEHVMVIVPSAPSPILTRELLYTGITRAKNKVTLVADRVSFEGALGAKVQRASGLCDGLWGCR